MKLIELLHETGIKCPQDIRETAEKREVTGIAFDSRKAGEGTLFVCLPGQHTDGHIYAAEAAFRGACAVVAQEDMGSRPFPVIAVEDTREALWRLAKAFYGDPSRDMRILGVTGTNGKTTITYMLQKILAAAGRECGVIGTIGCQVGPGRKPVEAGRTTPESFEIWQLLAEMRKNGLTDCAMEVSSHGLAMGRVRGITFDSAVFTNLTEDHMDFHQDMEDYYQAKKKLFYMTRGVSAVNIDDPWGERLLSELRADGLQGVSCSLTEPSADFFAEIQSMTERGSAVQFFREGKPLCRVELRIPGRFNAANALLAGACAMHCGVDSARVKEALDSFSGAPGRFELIENAQNAAVIVDYAHTPDALENALRTARSFTRGRLITVFGCGGDRDRAKRPIMGRIAGRYSDYNIITSDNPRSESQEVISREIEAGMRETGGRYEIIDRRKEAIERALFLYRPGDVVLIAGKGHETYQIIGGSKTYFSDKDTVQRALSGLDRSVGPADGTAGLKPGIGPADRRGETEEK